MVIKSMPDYPDCKDANSFQSGLEFQDFVVTKILDELGIAISNYASKYYQHNLGENRQGIEIKLDRRCDETKRLSIEIAEKTKAINVFFVDSGIYRNDNSWLYIQGSKKQFFIFSKKVLIRLHNTGRYQEHTEPTIKAFYLSFSECEKYAEKIFKF